MATELAIIQKNSVTQLRFHVKTFHEKEMVDIRYFYKNPKKVNDDQPEYIPTKKGITVNLKKWNEFYKIITKIHDYVSTLDLSYKDKGDFHGDSQMKDKQND